MRTELTNWKCLLALAFLFAIGCQKEASIPTEPVRPSNIPATSVWVGGLDGGVFVLVKRSKKPGNNMYLGEIYYISGDLAYKGPMKLVPVGSIDFDPTKKESFEGWDGDKLFLKNNQYLKTQE